MRLTLSLSLPPERASVTRARQILDTVLNLCDPTEESRDVLRILVTEACANAVVHGREGGPIEMAITVAGDECVVEVANPDSALDPSAIAAPVPDPNAEGGRGLPLIRALADDAEIANPRPGWVAVRMVKRLTTGGTTGGTSLAGSGGLGSGGLASGGLGSGEFASGEFASGEHGAAG
ncbi:MAG TPA: ATP-binding protein [Micromonosporaceae bacterium]|nr:ATP-binding protein [Micromonosporaceae bacterium]